MSSRDRFSGGMTRRGARVLAPALLLALALALGGCGEVAEKASEEAIERAVESDGSADVDVDSDDGSVKVETDEGTTSYGEDLDLPDAFPSDVPLPESDFSIVSSSTQGEDLFITMTLTDVDFDAEVTHLTSGFEESGYTVGDRMTSESEGQQFIMFTAKKGDVTVSVSLTGGDDAAAMYTVTTTP